MTSTLPSPWKVLSDPDGLSTPFYVIPFDRHGVCTGTKTLDQLVEASTSCTDVFVFSHGWTNGWDPATKRFEDFATAFTHERRKAWRPPTREYKPLLAGVFWPSASLVLPWELDENAALAEDLAPPQARRLDEMAWMSTLDEAQVAELAGMLAPQLGGEHDELDPGTPPPTVDELVRVWRQAGGYRDGLDPRDLIRLAAILLMKDRAGRVGGTGVATMLRRLIDASPHSRIHLIGHSYGAMVTLSALCQGEAPGRQVDSVLLLQPAVSCLCFASNVDGAGRPGAYRAAIERTRGPVVTTFSPRDRALNKLFHWAVRRPSDLGDAVIAGAPPSRYAALGGCGPHGAEPDTETLTARLLPQRYGFTATGKRIVAIDGTDVIRGHGDVATAATAWALLSQVMEQVTT